MTQEKGDEAKKQKTSSLCGANACIAKDSSSPTERAKASEGGKENKVLFDSVSARVFEEMVKEGIGAIPERFLEKLDNVDIVIEDEPTPYQLSKSRARKSSIILGLYEGVPQTKRGPYGQVLPDKITIFKKPIERMAYSEEEAKRTSSLLHLHPATRESVIKEIVKNTVWHEIAHHFGMDEKRVREAESHRLLKNRKSLK